MHSSVSSDIYFFDEMRDTLRIAYSHNNPVCSCYLSLILTAHKYFLYPCNLFVLAILLMENKSKSFANGNTKFKHQVGSTPGGVTLKFSVYIGEADFFGVKILNFHILGFQKN